MEQEESFLEREKWEGNGDEVIGHRMARDKRKKREVRLVGTGRNWFC